jgi:transposase
MVCCAVGVAKFTAKRYNNRYNNSASAFYPAEKRKGKGKRTKATA